MIPATPDSRKLDGLDVLRGVAALLVLLHHGFGSISLEQNYNTVLAWGLWERGSLGVNIFFVLSGFVIAWSNPRDGRSGRDVFIYVLRRFARIYPLYWIASATLLPVMYFFSREGVNDMNPAKLAHDVLLIPHRINSILWGSWTLVFEMMFYLLFIPMLINRRAGMVMWGTIAAVNIGLGIARVEPENPFLAHLTSLYVLEFFAGLLVCLRMQRQPLTPPVAKAMVWNGALLIAAFVVIETVTGFHHIPANLHYAACATLLVAGLVSLPHPPQGHSRGFRFLQMMGTHAFSIYLFHIPFQKFVVKAALKVTGHEPGLPVVWGVLLAALAVSLTAGILIGKFVEQPILEWCKKRIAKLKAPRPAPLPAAPPGSPA